MTEQIIITINPAPDGVHCGECNSRIWEDDNDAQESMSYCAIFSDERHGVRGPACLAAARTLREEREAARKMRLAAMWECYEIVEDERIKWDDEQSDLAYERAHEAECLRDAIKVEIDKEIVALKGVDR